MPANPKDWRYRDHSNVAYQNESQFPLRLRLLRFVGRQRWIPRGQDRLLRAIYNPDAGEHYYFDVAFFGQRYRGDLGHYIDWLVFCYGSLAYPEVCLLRDLTHYLRGRATQPITFYDIGANVGHHTLFMAPLADQVIAFEPSEDLIAAIADKIALNRLGNVRLFPYALGDADEEIAYFPGAGSNSGAGSLHQSFPGVSTDSFTVKVRKGDAFFASMNLPKMDLVKLDVQGYEPEVVRGLAERIKRDRPVILSEMTDYSRAGYGTEAAFRSLFYDDARFAEIKGAFRPWYKLAPFVYEKSDEVLIMPPELADFRDKLR
jgi:FkbM family methyltransferase